MSSQCNGRSYDEKAESNEGTVKPNQVLAFASVQKVDKCWVHGDCYELAGAGFFGARHECLALAKHLLAFVIFILVNFVLDKVSVHFHFGGFIDFDDKSVVFDLSNDSVNTTSSQYGVTCL